MKGLVGIPVFNEAGNLGAVIAELLDRFPTDQLLFIDDGSTDGSHHLLEEAGLRYLRHPINLGYEEALKTAMREVLSRKLEYVVFFDSDGQQMQDVEPHLFSVDGFLGEEWFVRSYWIYGPNVGAGWGGWANAAKQWPAARIMAFE